MNIYKILINEQLQVEKTVNSTFFVINDHDTSFIELTCLDDSINHVTVSFLRPDNKKITDIALSYVLAEKLWRLSLSEDLHVFDLPGNVEFSFKLSHVDNIDGVYKATKTKSTICLIAEVRKSVATNEEFTIDEIKFEALARKVDVEIDELDQFVHDKVEQIEDIEKSVVTKLAQTDTKLNEFSGKIVEFQADIQQQNKTIDDNIQNANYEISKKLKEAQEQVGRDLAPFAERVDVVEGKVDSLQANIGADINTWKAGVNDKIEQNKTAIEVVRGIANSGVGLPVFDPSTYTLTFQDKNGNKAIIDLPLEKMWENISYSPNSKDLIFHANDGSIVTVGLEELIQTYFGTNGAQINVEVTGNRITATLKLESVTYDHLSRDLQLMLENTAEKYHTHSLSDIPSLDIDYARKQHTHPITDINNLSNLLNGKQDKLTQAANAGEGITIDNNGKISSAGGEGSADGETIKNQNAASDVKKIKAYFGNSAEFPATLDDNVLGFQREYPSSYSTSSSVPFNLLSSHDSGGGTRVDDKMYIFGGYYNRTQTRDVIEIDLNSGTSTIYTNALPLALQSPAVAAYDTDIFVFGGAQYNDIVKFDTITKTATVLKNKLPSYLLESAAITCSDKIVLFGGSTINYLVNLIYEFDPKTYSFTTLTTKLPSSRSFVNLGIFGTKIYVFGGFTGEKYLDDILEYDSVNKTIITLSAKLPLTLAAASVESIGPKMYYFGGKKGSNSTDYPNKIYEFDAISKLIITLSTQSLPSGRSHTTSTIFQNNIYIFGGLNASQYLNQVVKYLLMPQGDFPNIYLPRPAIERLITEKAPTKEELAAVETLAKSKMNNYTLGSGLYENGNVLSVKATYSHYNIIVPVAFWVAHTDATFKFRAEIQLSINYAGSDNHVPTVVFGLAEAVSGNYAPVCELRYDDALLKEIVTIYAIEKPSASIIIPTITVEVA